MRRPLRLLTLLACLALLGACSRFDLAYRNLDWLLAWRIDRYLDLNAEQKAWLEPRLELQRESVEPTAIRSLRATARRVCGRALADPD